MSYRNDRFNRSMASLDKLTGDRDVAKVRYLSDGDIGVQRMLDSIDAPTENTADDHESLLRRAILLLVLTDYGYLAPTLVLIAEHAGRRDEILPKMARRTYFRNLSKLCGVFCK